MVLRTRITSSWLTVVAMALFLPTPRGERHFPGWGHVLLKDSTQPVPPHCGTAPYRPGAALAVSSVHVRGWGWSGGAALTGALHVEDLDVCAVAFRDVVGRIGQLIDR